MVKFTSYNLNLPTNELLLLTLSYLSPLLPTTLSKGRGQWTPLLTNEPFALTTSTCWGVRSIFRGLQNFKVNETAVVWYGIHDNHSTTKCFFPCLVKMW